VVKENKDLLSAQGREELVIYTKDYAETLASLKKHIQESQIRAISSANKELIKLYWVIGRTIVERQEKSGWGSKVLERLAKDLQGAFPGIEGFSRTNIFRMRAFYLAFRNSLTAVRQIDNEPPKELLVLPWGHNFVLLDQLKNSDERLWYAQKAVEHGWSRSILESWIKGDLYHREGKAITNFKQTLPVPQSDLAQQSLKDPYIFIGVAQYETLLTKALPENLRSSLPTVQEIEEELGAGKK
jgi:predicted nuclease of restriction endonuclease-like (RecB) superfamily